MNNNVQKIQISGIRRFFNKVSLYPDAISLTLGQPDFNVPENIKEKMVEAIIKDKNTYTPNMGIEELRAAISNYLSNMNIYYDVEEICVSVGGSEALFSTLGALINPGDKVLIPDPAYPAYESITTLLGGNVLTYSLDGDFQFNIKSIEKQIVEEKPKLMILSYPSNPTGATLSGEQKDGLFKIIKDNDILVLSDEIYCSICFEKEYHSIAQYEDIKDKIILVGGFSKMFSMTGLRVGYICTSKLIMSEIVKVHQYAVSCAPSVSQWGALEGLKNSMPHVERMKESFIKRRDYVYERLVSMGMKVNLPKGAFYIFPDIYNYNMKSDAFCDELLKSGKVAVVPGSAFGRRGEGYIRISYSYSLKDLENAMDRFEKWIIGRFN
jgi:aminotransferase